MRFSTVHRRPGSRLWPSPLQTAHAEVPGILLMKNAQGGISEYKSKLSFPTTWEEPLVLHFWGEEILRSRWRR